MAPISKLSENAFKTVVEIDTVSFFWCALLSSNSFLFCGFLWAASKERGFFHHVARNIQHREGDDTFFALLERSIYPC